MDRPSTMLVGRRAAPLTVLLLSVSGVLRPGAPALGQHGGMPPTPVVVTPVVERDIPPSLRLVGTVYADKTAVVAAEVDGIVAAFDAAEGDFLRAGQVICRIDPTVSTLRLGEAKARLDSLHARLQELEAGERPEERRRLEALANEAQAVYDKWTKELKRVLDLYAQGRGSDKEKYDTEMDHLAAERRLEAAKAALEMARNGTRPEVLAQARFAVAEQEMRVRLLERALKKTEIAAPFDGFIVAKRTEVGEWLESGGAVCEMVAIETVKVRADVPEAAIGFAQPGAPAAIEVEALGKTAEAKISRVIPRAAAAARTFPVEIDVPNAEHTLLPGMFVWTYVPAGPAGKRLMVSKDAIVAQGTSKRVFVIRPGPEHSSMALPVFVTTGLEVGGEVEIIAPDIKAGDQLVCRANERLFGPTPVTIAPALSTTSQPAGGRSTNGE